MLTKSERNHLKNLVDFRLKRCFAFAKEHGIRLSLHERPSCTFLEAVHVDGVDELDFRILLNCLNAFDGALGVYQGLIDVRYSDFVRSFCREFHYTLEEDC